MTIWPKATYLLLASRMVPREDGGFTVATLARARHMAATGVGDGAGPMILTVDPASPNEHAAHRDWFVETGMAASADVFRNLFDDAHAHSAWLWDAAVPGVPTRGVGYRKIDTECGDVIELPVVHSSQWHLTDATVVIRRGQVTRVLIGFAGLYRAWLEHVIMQARAADAGMPIVVVCESRQLGELLAGWRPPGVLLVHTVHTSHLGLGGVHARLWQRWFALMDAFDAVLWPTTQQLEDIVAEHGASPVHAVVPNAVPVAVTALIDPVPGRVVAVGRLAVGKRFDHALRTWHRVVQAVPGARLDIYGEGPLRPELEQFIAERDLSGSVTLHGHVDDLSTCRGGAVVVQTTAYEGQGLSALEALACGSPVVSYDVPYGPREMLGEGAGILVPDGDADALADAVISVLEDEHVRARMRARALARAADFAPDRVMRHFADVVREAFARRGGPSVDCDRVGADERVLAGEPLAESR